MKDFSMAWAVGLGGLLAGLAVLACGQAPEAEDAARIEAAVQRVEGVAVDRPARLLVCTRTNGFRHGSIGVGRIALEKLGGRSGAFAIQFTEGLEEFEAERLAEFDGVVFLNTTGELFLPAPAELENLNAQQREQALATEARLKENLRRFVEEGGAFIGIHSATDTFHHWPWYLEMIGGEFDGHPWGAGTTVTLKRDDEQRDHALVAMLPERPWQLREEIYQHKNWTAGRQTRLVQLDTAATDMSVAGIHRTDGDFPISWIRTQGEGRVFYCELGHNEFLYWDEKVLGHYLAGIQWALGQRE